MNNFVVGFLIIEGNVLLIKKKRPLVQKGKYNGIGGHIESTETVKIAMIREFKEEANGEITEWNNYCTILGDNYTLYCFKCDISNLSDIKKQKIIAQLKSNTDEEIQMFDVNKLPDNIVEDAKWLIPMACYRQPITVFVRHDSSFL